MMLGMLASGEDFCGRETECADLWHYLQKNHIVASGPRRLGKSSILNRIREKALADGIFAAHVDVQGVEGVQGFIAEIAKHFPDSSLSAHASKMSQQAKNWLAQVKKCEIKGPAGIGAAFELQVNNTQEWQAAAQSLQARLSPAPVLIFIDEFSVFLEKLLKQDTQQALALLAWLRAWRVSPGVACRFMFTGSIGLNALLEAHQLSAQVNDCYEYPIGPFKRIEALAMLRKFADDDGWIVTEATLEQLCSQVGWLSPYFLCLLLDETMKAARDRRDENPILQLKELTTDDVLDAYERMLSKRSRFIHWEQRLQRDLQGLDLAFALLLLTSISKKAEGLSLKQLSSRLAKLDANPDSRAARMQLMLAKLQEDGYLSPPDAHSKIYFLSFLLRDYWSRNHV